MGDHGITISPWDTTGSTPGMYTRKMEFVKPVNIPGCPTTRGVQTQRWSNYSVDSALVCVILQSDTDLKDVPYSTYFTVQNVCILTVTDGIVQASLTMCVKWHKSCMLQ